MSDLKDAIIIDGLVVSKFSRELFEDMARGGVTAANCTCSVWENFSQTMANISPVSYTHLTLPTKRIV